MHSASDELRRHYDLKYAAEASAVSLETIAPTAIPSDRFQACCRFFPEHFRGGEILELAAGSGLVARSLIASGLDFERYVASDFSQARLQGLEQTLRDPRVRVARLDAADIPDQELGHYDAVIMIALIEHLIDPLGVMQRARRLLKPGGFVYIDTPNVAKYTRRIKLLFGRFPATASRNEGLTTYDGKPVDLHDEGHLHYFTHRSLAAMLTQRCGFSRVEMLTYFSGGRLLGRRLDHVLARLRPALFSELCLVAYA